MSETNSSEFGTDSDDSAYDDAYEYETAREELDVAEHVILDLVTQCCTHPDGSIDSRFIGAYARAIRWLAKRGLMDVGDDDGEGRYVAGTLTPAGEALDASESPFINPRGE